MLALLQKYLRSYFEMLVEHVFAIVRGAGIVSQASGHQYCGCCPQCVEVIIVIQVLVHPALPAGTNSV